MGNKPHKIQYRRVAHMSFENILENRGKWSFLANCENIRWNRIRAEVFVFQLSPILTAGM